MSYKVLLFMLIINLVLFAFDSKANDGMIEHSNKIPLVLEITPPKTKYVENGRIYIEVRIRNISDHNVTVYKNFAHGKDIRFHIKMNGAEVKKDFSIFHLHDIRKEDFVILAPQSFYGRKFYIGNDFYPGVNKSGTVQITAEYRNNINGEKFGLKAWCGKLFSTSIKLFSKGNSST